MTWPVECVNCEFPIELSPLAAESEPETDQTQSEVQNLTQKTGSVVQAVVSAAGNFLSQLYQALLSLLGIPYEGPNQVQSGAAADLVLEIPDQVQATAIASGLINEFYFRVVPLEDGKPAGEASNHVRIKLGPAPNIQLDLTCVYDPELPECQPDSNTVFPYTAEIISYHGLIKPQPGYLGCYEVTETTTIVTVGTVETYPAGGKICKPPPEEPSFLEAVISFIEDTVNWVSNAYAELKSTVINLVAEIVPSSLCDKSCLGTLLDAGLMAMGIPPSIPNFDQLIDQGIDYLAAEVAAQVGIPPDLAQQLAAEGVPTDLIEQEAKEIVEAQVKQAIQDGVKASQVALGNSISWIPDGVPVKPHPLGEWQPPTLVIRITRDPNVTGDFAACSAQSLMIMATVELEGTNPGVEWFNNQHDPDLALDHEYWLYESEYPPFPEPLQPGESITIPIVLKPVKLYGVSGAWLDDGVALDAWKVLYDYGNSNIIVFSALGGTSTTCMKPASLSLPPSSVVP